MVRINRKPDLDEHGVQLDVEHELPVAEDDGPALKQPAPPVSAEEFERLKAARDAIYDRLARLQAEFDNYRKRAAREQADFKEYAVADAARLLLPILDSLERAVHTAPERSDLRSGLELILRQFHDSLAKLGVQAIQAKGKPFDPNQHQAIEMVETAEVPDQHVVEELQRGYRIKERLLRPAMVRVARNPHK
jgi:molecular chaperone GrpE